MTPAFQTANVTAYHGDAAEVLPALGLEVFDLLVTDPPYNEGTAHRRCGVCIDGDTPEDGAAVVAVLVAACRALRNHRHAYIFGPRERLRGIDVLTSPADLVWDKAIPGLGDLSRPFAPSHEPITFATKSSSPANRAQGDGRLTARLRQGSVLRVPRRNSVGTKAHPTLKPPILLRLMVEASSLPGEVVLDPFAGSGSTAVAAVLSGRRAVIIERDPGFMATARAWVEAAEAVAASAAEVADTPPRTHMGVFG